MRCRWLFIISIVALLFLTACGECKVDTDCPQRNAYTALCEDKECAYEPIPGVCGNGMCDAQENKCVCAQDCGPCAGAVPGSKYLKQQCIGTQCTQDVPASQIKPIYSSADLSSGGDKFKLETTYNAPFNNKKDLFSITITRTQQATANKEAKLLSVELTALTKDRRTITLASKNIGKTLWAQGTSITEQLIFNFPTAEVEGELSNVVLKIQYEYTVAQAGKLTTRKGVLQNRYREKLTFVDPIAEYTCGDCNDGNPGTRDYCDASNFCQHEPLPNICGNFKCDGNENKCTCVQDCGPCEGNAGQYLEYTCSAQACVPVMKPGVSTTPKSIFDERSIGPVQLHNTYKYSNPFNVNDQTFDLEFKISRVDPQVSGVTITTVMLLEGSQQIAQLEVDKVLSETASVISLSVSPLTKPEETRSVTLSVWYKYNQQGTEKTGKYTRSLEKITFIQPQ